MLKNPPANEGDIRDAGSITRLRRSIGEGNGNHFSIFAWRIPWAEKPGWGIIHRVTKSWTQLKQLSTIQILLFIMHSQRSPTGISYIFYMTSIKTTNNKLKKNASGNHLILTQVLYFQQT